MKQFSKLIVKRFIKVKSLEPFVYTIKLSNADNYELELEGKKNGYNKQQIHEAILLAQSQVTSMSVEEIKAIALFEDERNVEHDKKDQEQAKIEEQRLEGERQRNALERAEKQKLEEERRSEEQARLADKEEQEKQAEIEKEKRQKEENEKSEQLADQGTTDPSTSSSPVKPGSPPAEDKGNGKKYLALFLLLFLLGAGYFISCNIFGYCLKTPITDDEIERHIATTVNTSATAANKGVPDGGTGSGPSKLAPATTWYADKDNDGITNYNDTIESVEKPSGYKKKSAKTDECPDEFGPPCTDGCPDANGNCVADKYENKQTEGVVPTESENKATTKSNPDNTIKDVSSTLVDNNTIPYYFDQDGDGFGDPNKEKSFQKGQQPNKYVQKLADLCPSRPGKDSENGCPVPTIRSSTKTPLIGDKISLEGTMQGALGSDKYNWKGNVQMDSPQARSTLVSSKYVGKYRIVLSIENPMDGFSASTEESVHFKISEDQLKQYLIDLAEYGNYALAGRTQEIEKKKDMADQFFNNSIQEETIKLRKSKKGIVVNRKSFKDLRFELLTPKRSVETKIDYSNLAVSDISYDQVSGKISSFKYSF